MPRKPNPKPDDPEEYKRFLEIAKAVEADKDGKRLDRAIKAVRRAAKRDGS
jgi:hypothetical protein